MIHKLKTYEKSNKDNYLWYFVYYIKMIYIFILFMILYIYIYIYIYIMYIYNQIIYYIIYISMYKVLNKYNNFRRVLK